MFFRQKKSGKRVYLQIVENRWENGQSRQRVVATLGRLDRLRDSGQLDALLKSGARFAESVIERLLHGRRFTFPVERAVFTTVLHRLFTSGSDRSCMVWQDDYEIPGAEAVELHQMYRAMGWLGQALPADQQDGATPFGPRTTKGRPLCCELWPGNTTDVKTLIPIVDRLKQRFRITSICIVADRGMISRETIALLQDKKRQVRFILGARLRNVKEIYQAVLSRGGRYREVRGPKEKAKDPSPLKVKEVRVDDRRYVVCLNVDQAKKDKADREAIVASLKDQLARGAKSLVGNKGYRKYLRSCGRAFAIDEQKVKSDSRFDGKWVLQTDVDELSAEEVALKYKQLWTVEETFRSAKTLLETRPIFHKCDDTIRGHVFCSFLALVLRKELQDRLTATGENFEWADILRDLQALQHIEVEHQGKRFLLRSQARGTCGSVFRAAGVALPPTVQQLDAS